MLQQRNDLAGFIRTVQDFPTPGIEYRDITPLLRDPSAFKTAIDAFVEHYRDRTVDAVVGIESRGFLFSAPLAYALGVSLVPIRKFGRLPGPVHEIEYYLHFGPDKLQIEYDALEPGARVVVFDDLMASGTTLEAACDLVGLAGGVVEEVACLVELPKLGGREKLVNYKVYSLISG